MKKAALFLLLIVHVIKAQDKKVYTYVGFSIPMQYNTSKNDYNNPNRENETYFIPNGFITKIDMGFHLKKRLHFGTQLGLDWKANDKLVMIPVAGIAKWTPKLGDETRLLVQFGYGRVYALGRGNLQGSYHTAGIGIATGEGLHLFLDFSFYNLPTKTSPTTGALGIGLGITTY